MMPGPDVTEFRRFHELLTTGRQNYRPHYFPLEKCSKNPLEGRSWKNPKYRLTAYEAEQWMRSGHNIGIAACGKPFKIDERGKTVLDAKGDPVTDHTKPTIDGLVIIDQDDLSVTDFKEPTLKVRSRKRTGFHRFYWTDDEKAKVNIPTEGKGEVRAAWYYVVAPGSLIPTTVESLKKEGNLVPPDNQLQFLGRYTIENSIPPASITFEEFPEIFKDQASKADSAKPKIKHAKRERSSDEPSSALWTLKIEDVLGDIHSAGERFPSLFHISTTGQNTSVTPSSEDGPGLIHCWRHGVSLTPFQALAVLAELGDCVDIGEAHKDSKAGSSTLEYTRENIETIWLYAKEQNILPTDDLHPFQESARVSGYGPPESYFDVIKHPKSKEPPTWRFIPGAFVRDVLRNERFIIRSAEGKKGRLWRYSVGYYHCDGETYLLTLFKNVMGSMYPQTGRLIRLEILDAVRSGSFKDKEQLVDDVGLIPLKNGVLDWQTKRLRPYDRDRDVFFFQLPVSHDPTAQSPEIDKFHADVLPKEGVDAAIDYLACCLYRRPMKNHFIAYGPPHSAKTTEALLFEEFLGPDSVSNVKLQRIARDRFASAGLEDKLANIFADIGRGALRELGQINATTGMDKINLERKGVDSRENFQPYAKHWFCTNDLPRLEVVVDKKREDITSMDAWEIMAFFERFSLVEYGQVFSDLPREGSAEKKMDRHILERMTTPDELSGLLNKVLERMPEVVKKGPRTTRNAKETMMLYLRDSNPVQAFIVDGGIEFDHEYETTKEAVRGALQCYCAVHELQTKFSDNVIKNALMHHGVGEYRDEKGVERRRHWWTGIRLTSEWVLTDDDMDIGKKINEYLENEVRIIAGRSKSPGKPGEKPQCDENSPTPPQGNFDHASSSSPGFSHTPCTEEENNIRITKDISQNPGGSLLANPKHGGRSLGEQPTSPSKESAEKPPPKGEVGPDAVTLYRRCALQEPLKDWAIRRMVATKASGDKFGPFQVRQEASKAFPSMTNEIDALADYMFADVEKIADHVHKENVDLDQTFSTMHKPKEAPR